MGSQLAGPRSALFLTALLTPVLKNDLTAGWAALEPRELGWGSATCTHTLLVNHGQVMSPGFSLTFLHKSHPECCFELPGINKGKRQTDY